MLNKKLLFIFTLCHVGLFCFAQNTKIDSLLTVLKSSKEDTNKVNTLNTLSGKLWRNGDYEKAKKYAEQALILSEKVHFKKGEANANNNIGVIYSYQGNNSEALKNFLVALKISNSIGDKQEIADSYNNIALIYFYQGNYQEALNNHFAALKIFKEIANKLGIADSYNGIGAIYANQGNYEDALKNHASSLKIREEIGDKQGIATSYSNIGIVYHHQGNYEGALKNFFTFLNIEKAIGNKQGIADSHNNIGSVYQDQGNYPEALKNFFASLKIYEELDFKYGIAGSYNNIGNVYVLQDNYSDAFESFFTSIDINEEIGNQQGAALSYNNIAILYGNLGNYQEALKNHFASLEINEERGDKSLIASSLNNIGNIYSDQAAFLRSPDSVAFRKQLYTEALKNHFASLKIKEEIGDTRGITASYLNLGKISVKLKNLADAQKYLENALIFSKKIGSKEQIKDSYYHLANLSNTLGNWKSAYEQHKLYIIYRDSIDNEETQKKTIQASMNYEFEKREALTKAEQDKKDALADTEMKKQQIIRYAVSGILVLVILFTLFLYNRFRLIRKQKTIIELKERETHQQKEIIEEKHKEITDSINYAERIQRSFLATTEMLDRNLNSSLRGTKQSQTMHEIASLPADARNDDSNYFVFFKPKDVVSGDFYWAGELNNGNFALSCADSTGHGVPGAIMSILNISSLEKSIEKETEPNKILNTTRKIIIERLKKDGSAEGGKDGMDCSLLVINKEKTQLSFSAANNPVFIVRTFLPHNGGDAEGRGGFELIEFKADKMPVGKHDKDNESFTMQTVALQKGDIIYTLTDGFPDQFGGEKGKKYMIKNLKALLLQIAPLSMQEQEQKLAQEFTAWKGENEQVDDVCIIGVKI